MFINKYSFSLFIFFCCINFHFFSQVSASFTVDSLSGCSPLIVNFTNTSQNASQYTWDFGNGTTSSLTNPNTTYTSPGFYTIKLIAQNGIDIDSIIQVNYIQVFDLPTADFTFSSINFCEDDNLISFVNNSSGASSYFWDFGDGNSSTLNDPNHQFQQAGDYIIKLKAFNSNCSDLKTIGPITIFPTPIITAYSDTTFSCDSSKIFNFTGASSNTTITNWQWEFGDGNITSSFSGNTSHTYNTNGVYNPNVIATSANGCVDSLIFGAITIPLLSNYSIQSSISFGCPPLNVNFDILPSTGIQNVNWIFGDTNTSSLVNSVSNSYLNTGNYNVSSQVTDNNGCIQDIDMTGNISVDTAPTAIFSVTNTIGCPPLDVQFDVVTDPSNTISWDFGDTNASTNSNITHSYLNSGSFYPKLTLTSSNGCSVEYLLDTIIAGLDLTNFIANPTSGCAALEVDFTNSAPASATSFLWDFGDGNTSTDPNPTHIYDTIGEYTVIFTCSDTSGCTSNYTINDMITTFGEDDVVLPNQDTIYACSPYTFTADADNIGESYWNWDFGDGNYASGANVTHQYNESGSYTVLLNADAPNGCMYNLTNYAYLEIDNMNIDLNISINDDCNIGTVNVVNNSNGVVSHNWNMGDYNGYTTANIQHPYNTSNSYMITYEAMSSTGCVVTKYIPVVFNCDINGAPIPDPPPPIIDPPTDDTVVISLQGPLTDPVTNTQITQTCGPELVSMTSPFGSATIFLWDFGDGNTSTDKNPTHFYANAGTFDLTHYATFPNGDKDTLLITNFIDQYILDASFNLTKNPLCNQAEFQFSNSSFGATSWEWTLDSNVISTQSSETITLPLNDSVLTLNLKIEDTYGCVDQKQQSLFLYQPLVLMEQDSFACNSANAYFEASVVGDPIHSWDLGDGAILGPDTAVTHIYTQNGFYEVTLSLDDQGCVRQIPLDTIEIYQPDATFLPNSSSPICNTDSILFIANDSSYNNNKYNWSGATVLGSGDSTWIQFNDAGATVIELNIRKRGCRNIVKSDTIIVNKAAAYFNYNQLNGCIPIDVVFQDSSINPVSWDWNFGDGNNSSAQNPSHQYQSMPSDSVTLKITDNNGCHDSIKAIIINELEAGFNADDTSVCANTPVTFTGVDDVVNNWFWDFGDGNTSTDSIPTHYYQSAGNYQVRLIVSDGQGCNDTVIKNNYIDVQEVVADFNFSAPGTCPPIVTTFTNSSIGATDYLWDFGDGISNVIVENPSHIYSFAGSYYVTLIASNSGGCFDTLTNPDSLFIPGPQLNFSVDQIIGCDSLNVTISDSSVNTVDYFWDFGDGSSSNLTNPSHSYSSVGSYNIILVGADAANCTTYYTSTDTINIFPSPSLSVTISDSNVCLNSTISTINNTSADSHQWNYNNQSYTSLSPSIIIDLIGSNNLTYTATNLNGSCASSKNFNLIGHQIPDVSIIDQGIICSNQGLIDYNSTNGTILTTINWSGLGISDGINGFFDPSIVSDSALIYASFDSICQSQDSLIVIVENPPDASIISNDTIYCYGQIINTPIPVNSGGVWSGNSINPSSGDINDSLTPNIYSYNYILNNTNCSDTSIYQIEILHQNNATITTSPDICENADTLTLNAIDSGGVWSGQAINTSNGLINLNQTGIGTFDYIYSISGLCPDNDTISIEVFEFIPAQINPSVNYCEGTDSVQFTATSTGGIWSGLMNTYSANGWFITDSLPDGIHQVYYTISGICTDADTLNLTILPKPDISITFDQQLPCIGYPLNVINSSLNLVNEDFSWYVNDSLYYSNFNEPYFILDTGYYEVKVIATNQYLCETINTFNDSIIIYDTSALLSAEILRTTVFENSSIYTEWKDTSLKMNPLGENLIYRSTNNGVFEYISSIDTNLHSYYDLNVDINNNKYTYYIVSKNKCETKSDMSNIGTSINLNYERPEEFKTKLKWNFYDNWNEGVDRYEIQKLDINGQWNTISSPDSTINNILINE